MERKIVTQHVLPPIPLRSMDWCAWFDDDDELGPHGYGTTEEEAIQDLRESAEEWQRHTDFLSSDEGPYDHSYRRDMIAAGRGHLLRD